MFDQLYGGLAKILDDFNTPATPASGVKKPPKAELRNFLNERLQRSIWVQDAMDGVGSGGDDYQAFQDAIDYAAAEGHLAVRVKAGLTYNVEGDLIVPEGVYIIGDGPQGTHPDYGCTIIHHSNGTLFTFDGSGTAFAGTGGGMHNFFLNKGAGFAGGRAIRLLSSGNDNRPGEMMFSNIIAANHFSDALAQWLNCFEIDGTASPDAGNRGVRTTRWYGCRGAACSDAGGTWNIKQATHLYMFGCGLDQGVGAVAGIKFSRHNDSVFIYGANFAGNVLINAYDANPATGTSLQNFHFYGKCGGTFINNDVNAKGVVVATEISGSPVNKSRKLHCTFPDKPQAYIAYRNSVDSDRTGDATVYTVPFDQEFTDLSGLSTLGTGAILVAGRYGVECCVTAAGLAAGNTSATIQFARTIGATEYWPKVVNPSGALWSGQYYAFDHKAEVVLDYGDNIATQLSVSGGSKVVDIYGAGGGLYHTWMSLKYLGTA